MRIMPESHILHCTLRQFSSMMVTCMAGKYRIELIILKIIYKSSNINSSRMSARIIHTIGRMGDDIPKIGLVQIRTLLEQNG